MATPPPDDYPDTPEQAVPLAIGTQLQGVISPYSNGYFDVDYFRVHLDAGHSYLFSTSAAATLTLERPAGGTDVYARSDTAETTTLFFQAQLTGDYVVKVDHWGTWESTPYVIGFKETKADDFGVLPGTRGKLVAGTTVTGVLSGENDTDGFTLQGVPGTSYRLTVVEPAASPDNTMLTDVRFDDNAVHRDSPSADRRSHTFSFALPADGTLNIDLGADRRPGAYTLQLALVDGDLPADASTTGALALGAPVHGHVDADNDVDWYRVHLDAGQSYLFSHSAGGLQVYDAGGQLLAPSRDVYLNNSVGYSPASSGEYYVAASGSTRDYTVTMATVPDDVPAAPASQPVLRPGQPITGTINYAGDDDGYRIDVVQGAWYRITASAATSGYGNLRGELRAADGSIVASGTELNFRATTTGQLTYVLTQGSNVPSAYTVQLEAPVLDAEPDGRLDALAVGLNAERSGAIDFSQDQDTYRIRLDPGQAYDLQMSGSAGITWSLLSTQYRVSGYHETGGMRFTAVEGGDYFLTFAGNYPATSGTYSFSFSPAADAVSANTATTGRLAMNGSTAAQLDYARDVNWYAVELQDGHTYQFQVGAGGPLFSTLGLHDSAGREIGLEGAGTIANDGSLTYVAGHTGRYYLSVASVTPGLPFQISTRDVAGPDDAANDIAHAAVLPLGQVVTGRLTADDVDVFRVPFTDNGVYEASVRFLLKDGRWVEGWFPLRVVGQGQTYDWGFNSGERYTSHGGGDQYLFLDAHQFKNVTGYAVVLNQVGQDRGAEEESAPLGLGAYGGTLEHSYDRDSFAFSVQKGKTYTFSLHNFASGPNDALVVRFDGARQDEAGPWTGSVSSTVSVTSGGDGTVVFYAGTDSLVHLEVGPQNQSTGVAAGTPYLIRMTVNDADHSAPRATAASLGAAPAGGGAAATVTVDASETVVRALGTVRVVGDDGVVAASFDLGRDPHVRTDGQHLILDLPGLLFPGGRYTVEVPAGALTDQSGNPIAAGRLPLTVPKAAAPGAGNDVLAGGSAGVLDGGAGIDTVVYRGARTSYEVHRTADGAIVSSTAGTDHLANVERIMFGGGGAWAVDVDGPAGQLYRLYQAAFGRPPDPSGIGYWLSALDRGASLPAVARTFLDSPEFNGTYGSLLSNAQFLDQLYHNVLHRAGEAEGTAYWTHVLDIGAARADVLLAFADSKENVTLTGGALADGFAYTPFWA